MFRVKICGITSVADAQAAIAAGADAIGLNFYPRSPRCVSVEAARQIAAGVPEQTLKVGVFVNAPAEEVRRTCDALRLSAVQLHGDEPPEMLRELGERPLIRAVRCPAGSEPAAEYVAACRKLGVRLAAVLVDSAVAGQYGGTGRPAPWELLAHWRGAWGDVPLILAGGLTADNVAAAIGAVRPTGVDVASGVETEPGRKSPRLMQAFVAAAQQAFRQRADAT